MTSVRLLNDYSQGSCYFSQMADGRGRPTIVASHMEIIVSDGTVTSRWTATDLFVNKKQRWQISISLNQYLKTGYYNVGSLYNCFIFFE